MSDEDELRKELEHVAAVYRDIHADDGFTWRDTLLQHRRQCIENLRDSEDDWWAERVKLLDAIAEHEGIPLAYETSLRWVLDGLDERRRSRQAARIEDQRARAARAAKMAEDAKKGQT